MGGEYKNFFMEECEVEIGNIFIPRTQNDSTVRISLRANVSCDYVLDEQKHPFIIFGCTVHEGGDEKSHSCSCYPEVDDLKMMRDKLDLVINYCESGKWKELITHIEDCNGWEEEGD